MCSVDSFSCGDGLCCPDGTLCDYVDGHATCALDGYDGLPGGVVPSGGVPSGGWGGGHEPGSLGTGACICRADAPVDLGGSPGLLLLVAVRRRRR